MTSTIHSRWMQPASLHLGEQGDRHRKTLLFYQKEPRQPLLPKRISPERYRSAVFTDSPRESAEPSSPVAPENFRLVLRVNPVIAALEKSRRDKIWLTGRATERDAASVGTGCSWRDASHDRLLVECLGAADRRLSKGMLALRAHRPQINCGKDSSDQ